MANPLVQIAIGVQRWALVFVGGKDTGNQPKSCFVCPFLYVNQKRCQIHGSDIIIDRVVKDGDVYTPVCAYQRGGTPLAVGDDQVVYNVNVLGEKAADQTGLEWAKSPTGTNCGGFKQGADCKHFVVTEGNDGVCALMAEEQDEASDAMSEHKGREVDWDDCCDGHEGANISWREAQVLLAVAEEKRSVEEQEVLVTSRWRNDMPNYERRQYANCELRASGGDGHAPLHLTGYAATFEGRAEIGGPKGFTERINPKAFTRALAEQHDVTCRFNHDPSFVLGRTTAGTLKLRSDSKGLWFECLLPETQQARDLHTSVSRGDIRECSFGFSLPMDGGERWFVERGADGKARAIRELLDVDLHDVSAVTEPAYNNTKVFARSDDGGLVPMEIRSELAAMNENVEARVYASTKEVPSYVPADKKAQWKEVWNSAHAAAKKDGKSDKDAEEAAFAQANGVAGPNSGKKSAEDTMEKRDIDSFEEAMNEIRRALSKAFPQKSPNIFPGDSRYWILETYPDYVIVSDSENDGYCRIPYTHDESKPEGEEITFGEPIPVEKEWVPAERHASILAQILETRQALQQKRDDDEDKWEYNVNYGVSEDEWKSMTGEAKTEMKSAYLKKAMRSAEEDTQSQVAERSADVEAYAESVRVSMEAGLPIPPVTEFRFSNNPAHAVNHTQHSAATEYHNKQAEVHDAKGQKKAAELHRKAAEAHKQVVDGKLSGASDESKAARSASVEAAEETKRCMM